MPLSGLVVPRTVDSNEEASFPPTDQFQQLVVPVSHTLYLHSVEEDFPDGTEPLLTTSGVQFLSLLQAGSHTHHTMMEPEKGQSV
jgi:hypothetical protein